MSGPQPPQGLEGTTQAYASPPSSTAAPGAAPPRRDYQCRCTAEPIIPRSTDRPGQCHTVASPARHTPPRSGRGACTPHRLPGSVRGVSADADGWPARARGGDPHGRAGWYRDGPGARGRVSPRPRRSSPPTRWRPCAPRRSPTATLGDGPRRLLDRAGRGHVDGAPARGARWWWSTSPCRTPRWRASSSPASAAKCRCGYDCDGSDAGRDPEGERVRRGAAGHPIQPRRARAARVGPRRLQVLAAHGRRSRKLTSGRREQCREAYAEDQGRDYWPDGESTRRRRRELSTRPRPPSRRSRRRTAPDMDAKLETQSALTSWR